MQTAYLVFIVDSKEPLVELVTNWLNDLPPEATSKLPIVRGLIADEMPDPEDVIDLYAVALQREMHDDEDEGDGPTFVFGEQH